MFRNKKTSRAPAPMANATPSSSAASTAAVQAFLASQSNSKLSSAAAAAALRSHTASPTNPALIQTKRMQRRLSASSNGSAASAPALQRRGSNSSMTDRTFRAPSPLRSPSPLANRPPVPPMPKNIPKSRPPPTNARPMSAEPPIKGRPQTSRQPHTRVASLDRGNVKPKNEFVPPMPKPKPARIDTNVKEVAAAKRPQINFSRPMSPTISPPASPAVATNGSVKKPDSKAVPNGNVNTNKKPAQNSTPAPAGKSTGAAKSVDGANAAAGRAAAAATKDIANAVAKQEGQPQSGNIKQANVSKPPPPSQQSPAHKKEEGGDTTAKAVPTEKITKQPPAAAEGDAKSEAPARQQQQTAKSTSKTEMKPTGNQSSTPNGKASVSSGPKPVASKSLSTPETDSSRRRTSLSPARTARFSAQPVSNMSGVVKHEPLRAASPAKSALKHSPTPRGPSPALIASDISDNASVASDEGTRKRRSMRVSFENGPTIVGSASEVSPNPSPFIFSPQDKDPASRPHFDFGKKLDDYEPDEVITPVPTLPSFGSIRGRSDRHVEEHSVLYGDEQARKNLAEMTSSSDHAIGAIVHQDASRLPNDPVPPQVTSVEGSGYQSDVEGSDEDDKPSANTDEAVPTIAVVPATPGLDAEATDNWLVDNADTTKADGSSTMAVQKQDESLISQRQRSRSNSAPERESIVEPEPESVQREHDPHTPVIGTIAESLQKHNDDGEGSDSGNSVYSDAAEDPVELEGDGFGSINAIVDSPVPSPIVPTFNSGKKDRAQTREESPSPAELHPPAPDWEPTKAYWSGITDSKKSGTEPDSVGVAVTSSMAEHHVEDSARTEKPIIPEKSSARAQTPVADPAIVPKTVSPRNQSNPSSASKPAPKKSAMKSSMRQASPAAPASEELPAMRKSMRGPRPTSMKSDPGNTARPSVTNRQRQDSDISQTASVPAKGTTTTLTATNLKKLPGKTTQPLPVNGSANKNTKRMSTMSTKSAPPTQTSRPAPPKLSRTFSNDSDSSSSFKRERARKPRSEKSYAMKRSMRAAPAAPQAERPMSPDSIMSSRSRPMSMSGVSLRTSMRDTSSMPARPSSMRVASPNGSFFGRRKNNNSKPVLSRNFSDSSGVEVPTTFRSRFENSSDEEDEPQTFSPVRGIPRRIIEEESTDLEDSDEDSRPQPKSAGTSAPVAKAPGLAGSSMRPMSPETPAVTNLSSLVATDKRPKSIFGVLGRRKDKSKIGKSELDSAARRDTPLERSKFERKDRPITPEPPTPLDTPLGSPAGSPSPAIRPGKLQRRAGSSRTASELYFPPPSIPADIPAVPRPTTSDGSPQRPALGLRNPSNMTTKTDGIAVGRSGKKKRFPMLRKAFGLHD